MTMGLIDMTMSTTLIKKWLQQVRPYLESEQPHTIAFERYKLESQQQAIQSLKAKKEEEAKMIRDEETKRMKGEVPEDSRYRKNSKKFKPKYQHLDLDKVEVDASS